MVLRIYMAKNIIEKPPFVFNDELLSKNYVDMKYMLKYKEVDDRGKYLYWDQLKWRIAKSMVCNKICKKKNAQKYLSCR